jgi:hypothetical protein
MHLPPFLTPSLPFPLPSPSLPSAVRVDAGLCPRGSEKFFLKSFFFFLNFFFVVVAGLEREKKFTIFGFRFSIPEILELPELRGLRGRSREKKKVFSA